MRALRGQSLAQRRRTMRRVSGVVRAGVFAGFNWEGLMIDRVVSPRAAAFSRNFLKAGVAVLAVAAATPALAQTAPAPAAAPATNDAETIVVSGYARSLQNAIRTKKVSTELI